METESAKWRGQCGDGRREVRGSGRGCPDEHTAKAVADQMRATSCGAAGMLGLGEHTVREHIEAIGVPSDVRDSCAIAETLEPAPEGFEVSPVSEKALDDQHRRAVAARHTVPAVYRRSPEAKPL